MYTACVESSCRNNPPILVVDGFLKPAEELEFLTKVSTAKTVARNARQRTADQAPTGDPGNVVLLSVKPRTMHRFYMCYL